jgi:outer membrane protein TolC
MFVRVRDSSSLIRTGLCLALGLGCAAAGWAQSADLPSAPAPNPSSLSNPYFGSVTVAPATDEVVKLSLDEAVTRGLKTNLGLKEAEVGEGTLHGEKLEALQEFLPTVTVTGGTGVHEYNLAALGFGPGVLDKLGSLFPSSELADIHFITKADVTTGQVNYEQTLFSGPVISGYGAAKAAERSAYFAKMSARGEVVQQVATAYLAVIADQSEVDNASALLDADRVLFEQAKAKHEAGTAANLDELRARVQYQQQQQTLIAAENKRQKAEILLKREIGLAPGQKIALTDPAPYSDLAACTPEDLRTEAYANRQDYQNLQAQQLENRKILEARKQERLPTLSFKGNYGVTGVNGAGYHGTFSAMGTLKVPVFKEGTLRGDTDVAKAQFSASNLQLGDLKSKIDQQVRAALLNVEAARKLVEVARSNVDLAGSALSDETDRFNAGIDDTLPLVQAQSTLASAQSNLVESLYQYNLAKLQLARSAGVLEQQYKVYLGK